MEKQYIVKEAAGIFWLIDVSQEGVPYHEPLQINEIGADIFYMLEKYPDYDLVCLEKHMQTNEIIDNLCAEYTAPREVIAQDVQEFINKLESYIGKVQEA